MRVGGEVYRGINDKTIAAAIAKPANRMQAPARAIIGKGLEAPMNSIRM